MSFAKRKNPERVNLTCQHQIFEPMCSSCKSLQIIWYKKAEESGFEDVEKNNNNIRDLLKLQDCQTPEMFQAKMSYYQWARSKAYDGMKNCWFRSEIDRKIWEGHAEGNSRRTIAEEIGLDDSWIAKKIKRIRRDFETGSISSITFQLSLF